MWRLLPVAALLLATAAVDRVEGTPPSRRNVLYTVYDDLRPDLSLYNLSFMHTPNLQKLADTGTTFDRAYCQQTVCAPSRMSFTSGRRPNSTRTWNFLNHFRQAECPTERGTILTGDSLLSAPPTGWGCDNCRTPFPSNQSSWGFHSPGSTAQYSGGVHGASSGR